MRWIVCWCFYRILLGWFFRCYVISLFYSIKWRRNAHFTIFLCYLGFCRRTMYTTSQDLITITTGIVFPSSKIFCALIRQFFISFGFPSEGSFDTLILNSTCISLIHLGIFYIFTVSSIYDDARCMAWNKNSTVNFKARDDELFKIIFVFLQIEGTRDPNKFSRYIMELNEMFVGIYALTTTNRLHKMKV